MPIRLATPLLSVDVGKMSKVDTRNVENLFGMWTGKSPPHLIETNGTDRAPSVLEMCRVDGRWSPLGKPQLANLESRNVML